MNLQILKRSRRPPQAGDIFALRPKGHGYYFGRVIRIGTKLVSLPTNVLIYIYRAHAPEPVPAPPLSRDALLVPPIVTNRLPWTRGFFQVVDHRPLETQDVLATHCFLRFDGRAYDEWARELPARLEPCGEFGLHSYRTIDDAISRALGIPLAPD